jgi:predicted patatin/cPLA2 family phospholipase
MKRHGLSERFMRWHVRHYLFLKQAMTKRVERYNESVAIIRRPPDGVSIIEICPPGNFRVSRLSQNRMVLQEGYEQGRSLAAETIARWNSMTNFK